MPGPPQPQPRAGELILPEQFRAVADLAAYGAGLSADGTSGLLVVSGPGGPIVTDTEVPTMKAKITSAAATGGRYAWTRIVPVPGNSHTTADPTGTTASDPAYERSGSLTVPLNQIIELEREAGEWRFSWMACA